MGSPLASIIIDNYNYDRYVGEAIESALNQTYRPTEVIVVDDGSSDESRKVIAYFGERIKAVFKTNGGQGSAFNAGYAISRGDIVSFLDSDDVHLPTAIERAAILLSDPGVAKVHWPLWLVDEQGTRLGKKYPNAPLAEGDLRESVYRIGPTNYLHAPNSGNVWARWFLDQILPFPETLYRNGCDTLLFEAAPFFGKIECVPEPQTLYRQHSRNDHNSMSAEQKVQRELLFYDHYAPFLQQHCRRVGVDASLERWRKHSWWHLHEALLSDVATLPNPDRALIVVDDATLELGELAGRPRIAFTEQDGEYAGLPENEAAAIRELEILRARGAAFIVFAWVSFWWREHFPGLFRYLHEHYAKVLDNERCIVFQLT